jgi:hypothetical protein
VELGCISIGHIATNLNDTATHIATALAKVRPSIATQYRRKCQKVPETSKTALLHDKRDAKTFLDKMRFFAQTLLLGIKG